MNFKRFLSKTKFQETLCPSVIHIHYDAKIDNIQQFNTVCRKAFDLRGQLLNKNSVVFHISVIDNWQNLKSLFDTFPKFIPPPRIFLFNLGEKSLLDVKFDT